MSEEYKDAPSTRASIVTWGSLIAAGTLALTIVGGAIVILNWQYNESNNIRKEVTQIQIDMAKNLITKLEFKESMRELSEKFDRSFEKLEKRDTQRWDNQRFMK